MNEVNKFSIAAFCIFGILIAGAYITSRTFSFADSDTPISTPSDFFNDSIQVIDNQYIQINYPVAKNSFIDTSIKTSAYKAIIDTGATNVKTGDTVSIYSQDGKLVGNYTISIKGDIDGDGEITPDDVAKMYQYYKNITTLDHASELAGDVTNTGSIGLGDLAKIYQYTKGKIESLD